MSDERPADHHNQSGYGESEISAIESAESYLAASAATGDPGNESRTPFSTAFEAILTWGEDRGLIRKESEFPFFLRSPDGYGNEHEAWFDESLNRWYKSTYPNKFGLAWGRRSGATAWDYLKRLILQNEYFGDDIRLIALVRSNKQLRILTSQPHVPGNPATAEEIQTWFRGLGYSRLESDGCIAWYRKDDNLLVADAHEGNVIRSSTGACFAIDLNVIKPDSAMRQAVLSVLGMI